MHLDKVRQDLEKFWDDVNPIMEKNENKPMIQNIARAKFSLRNDPQLKSWFELDARVSQPFIDPFCFSLFFKQETLFYLERV